MTSQTPRTLYDKLWDAHVVVPESDDAPAVLYVDLHLIHEVTSPQAFTELDARGLSPARPDRTKATMDHSTPTLPAGPDGRLPYASEASEKQVDTLARNCARHGIELFDMGSDQRGIVHVIAPELGLTRPGMTIVCGDSHTATHGAFGALAFGIGTSEVEHVLATQTLLQYLPKTYELRVSGDLAPGVTAKDMILYLIGQLSTHGGTGYVLEYTGSAIRNLSMEERMTVCNMSIEAGARAGMIAPDETTFEYLKGRPFAPQDFDAAVQRWKLLPSDPGAHYDKVSKFEGADIEPQVTWGTNPGQVGSISIAVPNPADCGDETEQKTTAASLEYMGLKAGTLITDIDINRVFIGSCTNARIEDLRAAAKVVKGYRVSSKVNAMVVPGSGQVKRQAEAEGLDKIFTEAGFEWREAGCSMCLAMNPDRLEPGDRCASTSNRNFEGRQGKGGRTHLVSPAMAAAAAIEGHFNDIRQWNYKS